MNRYFVEALDMQEHPIKKAKKKIQAKYFAALTWSIEKTISETNICQSEAKEYITERLRLYQTKLFADDTVVNVNEKLGIGCLRTFAKPWRKQYGFILVCDVALILLEEPFVSHAIAIINELLSSKRQIEINQIVSLLHNDKEIERKFLPAASLLKQYRTNNAFFSQREKRIIITANISAGKSTLINALVGKTIARTSQEVCTGNVCYFFNKAYEDDNIHLLTQDLNLSAAFDDLREYDWSGHVFIASYFAGIPPEIPRMCIVDTPGVDAALYKEHSKLAHNALLNDRYDTVVYVVSPTRLGTEAEKKHLQWIAQNLQKDKVIFVLNKLDDYRDFSDSIEESVNAFKDDLLEIGFEEPVICPISAYFSYLLKLKMTGQAFSEDEADEYALYSKKFMRSSYDLSRYYDGVQCLSTDSEEITLSKRAGLYGLEKIIYGGGL